MPSNFEFFGMPVRVKSSTWMAMAGVFILLTGFAVIILEVSPLWAMIGGLLGVAAHWLNCLVHHWGHYQAGKMQGHPLREMVMWGLLGTDLYPAKEGKLTPAIHRQRALGGPLASFAGGIAFGLVALVVYFMAPDAAWVPIFAFIDGFGVFGLGGFIPLHWIGLETDGSTLLKYWNQ